MNASPISRRRRGSAMTEMVLVLPFFLIVLSLLFYLGRGMVRVQHTQVVDRYEAWRATSGAPEPAPNKLDGNSVLNQAFYMNKAATLEIDEHNIRVTAFDELFKDKIEEDSRQTPEGALLAHEVHFRNAAWFFTHVKSEHNLSAGLWDRLDGPMYHTHIRMGHDWSFATLWKKRDGSWSSSGGGFREEAAIREAYFTKLDTALTFSNSSSNPKLAQRIQNLYASNNIYYIGPTVY